MFNPARIIKTQKKRILEQEYQKYLDWFFRNREYDVGRILIVRSDLYTRADYLQSEMVPLEFGQWCLVTAESEKFKKVLTTHLKERMTRTQDYYRKPKRNIFTKIINWWRKKNDKTRTTRTN